MVQPINPYQDGYIYQNGVHDGGGHNGGGGDGGGDGGEGGGGGHQEPPPSPADPGADTGYCPVCQVMRTALPYATGLGAAQCVACQNGDCADGVDWVFMECGHAIHAVCPG